MAEGEIVDSNIDPGVAEKCERGLGKRAVDGRLRRR
jgi:hypothetical protein